MEETKSVFIRASSGPLDKQEILNAFLESKECLTNFPLENLEDEMMSLMMPCMRNLFLEVYKENEMIESLQQTHELMKNLTIIISVFDIIEDLLKFISLKIEFANLKQLKSVIIEIPKCFYFTYKHCKESQKKYQDLMRDSKEIILLYKKNQDCHLKFLNIISQMDIENVDETSRKLLIETLESCSNITEILVGLNIKALADSWKIYCTIIEKHKDILTAEKFFCVREIQLLQTQMKNFMDIALVNDDEKILSQYSKLSGFLLKVALKMIVKFWQYLRSDHLELVYNLVCCVYNYSPELLQTNEISVDMEKSIQTCLLDVISSFIEDNFFNENILEEILSYMDTKKQNFMGCMVLNLRILKFISQQPPDSLDTSLFAAIVNTLIDNFSSFFSSPQDVEKIPTRFIEKISQRIVDCIEVHNSFYDQDFESVLMSNILSDNVGRHMLASYVWIDIISQASPTSRRELVSVLMDEINNLVVELSFTSLKVILLKNFMRKLFNVLHDDEKEYILNLYPPLEYLHLWKIIGLVCDPGNNNSVSKSLLDFSSTNFKDMKSLASVQDVMKSIETMKILAEKQEYSQLIDNSLLINITQNLWNTQFEAVPDDNQFLKYFMCRLFEITINLISYFSNDQIFLILKRLETLANNKFIKIRLCTVLSRMLSRKTEHNLEQNKLNFLISDLFELLFKDNDETLREFTLKVFQQFSTNKYLVIVNNVSRMLPDLNLEQYLRNHKDNIVKSDKIPMELPELNIMEHKCYVPIKKSISAPNSFEWKSKNVMSRENSSDSVDSMNALRSEARNELPRVINRPTLGLKRNTSSYNVQHQNKKVRLSEDAEEDDTISDVLQRIRSEIKCLNKILFKEKPTPKNAQDIKLLACQMQSLLER